MDPALLVLLQEEVVELVVGLGVAIVVFDSSSTVAAMQGVNFTLSRQDKNAAHSTSTSVNASHGRIISYNKDIKGLKQFTDAGHPASALGITLSESQKAEFLGLDGLPGSVIFPHIDR